MNPIIRRCGSASTNVMHKLHTKIGDIPKHIKPVSAKLQHVRHYNATFPKRSWIADNIMTIFGALIGGFTTYSLLSLSESKTPNRTVKINVGNAEEIVYKIQQAKTPYKCDEFAKIFAGEISGKTFDPESLVEALAECFENYRVYKYSQENLRVGIGYPSKAVRFQITMVWASAPEILCIFSEDKKMQAYLKALWEGKYGKRG